MTKEKQNGHAWALLPLLLFVLLFLGVGLFLEISLPCRLM